MTMTAIIQDEIGMTEYTGIEQIQFDGIRYELYTADETITADGTIYAVIPEEV